MSQPTSAPADQLLPNIMQSSGLTAASFFTLVGSHFLLFHMSVLMPIMVSADYIQSYLGRAMSFPPVADEIRNKELLVSSI